MKGKEKKLTNMDEILAQGYKIRIRPKDFVKIFIGAEGAASWRNQVTILHKNKPWILLVQTVEETQS